jgi:ribosomal protein S18 acetylase RimI-like enzyme
MEIRDLANTPMPVVVDSFLRAFEGYFVQLPSDLSYWEDRFHSANVDLSRSYGAFDEGQLVAFIIQAFGTENGEAIAYNTGTGVWPAYRGKHLVDALYAKALPVSKAQGIRACTLEVIVQNAAAIRVYERIGFRTMHLWKSYVGTLRPADLQTSMLMPMDLHTADLGDERWYSWDNRMTALLRSNGNQQLFALDGDPAIGHVVLNPSVGRLARLSVADEHDMDQWQRLLTALASLQSTVKVINVHHDRTALLAALTDAGLTNRVDQYEMRMDVR